MGHDLIIKNFKCFKDETYIEKPVLVNLIIGRNNCGKTSLTNVFEYLYSDSQPSIQTIDSVKVDFSIDDSMVEQVFPKNISRGPGFSYNEKNNQYSYGKKLIGKPFQISVKRTNDGLTLSGLDYEQNTIAECKDEVHYSRQDWNGLAIKCLNSIHKKTFCKISAERDIVPEKNSVAIPITENGEGVTTKIDYLLNVDGNDYALVSNKLLEAINMILEGENHYTDIAVVREEKTNLNYICLKENNKRIRLDDMGSGLKTIILVLFNLLCNTNYLENTVFIFEELENNLHPEIQRRLFNYIYDFCTTNKCHVFITSHSHVSINCFYGKKDAAIYHVYKKENGSSTVEKIKTYLDKTVLLDDLGVRASDIFQSNGIIWVEGPSDRIYINKWLNIHSPNLKENIDYVFLYYGGKNLAHYTASELDELIRVLLINRNGVIVMDSDLNSEEEQELRDTKKRIKKEFESNNMYAWVTAGKEIENYIDCKDLNAKYGTNKYEQIGKYEKFDDYIREDDPTFSSHKVEFAKSIVMDNNSLDVLDLREKINNLADIIKKWNNKKD